MRTMFFKLPSVSSQVLMRGLSSIMCCAFIGLLYPGQSAAQTLDKVAQLGRNRVGSTTYNGVSAGGESYTIVGGGYDIFDNQDEFTFRYTEVLGNFDVKVRIESLTANATHTKAGIMVRESLAEDSRMLFALAKPPAVAACAGGTGGNVVRLGYRTGLHVSDVSGGGNRFNDGGNDGRHEDGVGTPQYPNAWIRLVREGNVFTAYTGTDGSTWTVVASQDTGTGTNWLNGAEMRPFANKVFLGLGVSRHSGPLPACATATGEFRDFMLMGDSRFCLIGADSLGCSNQVLLTFSRPVGANALDIASYDFAGGVQFLQSARAGSTPNTVVLTTDDLTDGTVYTLTVVGDVRDNQNNPIDPACTVATFKHAEGYLLQKVHLVYNQAGPPGDSDPVRFSPNYANGLLGGRPLHYGYFESLAYQEGHPVPTSGQPTYHSNPTYFEDGPSAIVDDEGHETYFVRIMGVLEIKEDGNYKFAVSSDDGGALFLSSDANPANKVEIAREPEWSGTRIWSGGGGGGGRGANACGGTINQSCPIPLTNGGRYYLEYVVAEGGGGNHSAVTWDAGTGTFPPDGAGMLATDPADPIWQGKGELVPVRWHRNSVFTNLGAATVTTQPQSQTIAENGMVCFSVNLEGSPPYAGQWKTNGVAVPGATSTRYCFQAKGQHNGVAFTFSVTNAWGGATSDAAILTVLCNPIATNVSSRGNCHAVYVQYTKEMLTNGTYTILCSNTVDSTTSPLTVTGISYGQNSNEVVLSVSPDLSPDTNTYYLTITGAQSFDACVIAPDPTTLSFIHGAEYPMGNVFYTRYEGTGNGNLAAALAHPKVINDIADVVVANPNGFFEALQDPDGDLANNYTARVRGFYIAPQDGEYRFWMSSDDQGATYIATDAVPANKVQIAAEPQWGGVRAWADAGGPERGPNGNRGTPPIYNPPDSTTGNGSLPIPLVAGQRVYLELLFTEGGGGDNGAVTVTIDDPAVPINGTAPIAQDQFLAIRRAPSGELFTTLCDVFCNPGPEDQTVYEGQSARFGAFPDGTPPYTMQWYKDTGSGPVAIAGATGASYTTPPTTLADEGTVYIFRVSNAFSTNECSATLQLNPAPVVISCETRNDPLHVYVTYNKAVSIAGGTAQYALTEDATGFAVTISGIAHGSTMKEAVLTIEGSLPDTAYTLTITGVEDQETPANTIEPDPTICTFGQGPGRFCADFNDNVVPMGTIASGTVAPIAENGYLVLTRLGVTGNQNFWTIPVARQTLDCFSAQWKTLLAGVGQADGISFNVGVGPFTYGSGVAEEGANNGLSVTVDTFNNADISPGGEVGIEARWNGQRLGFTQVPPGTVNGPPVLMKNQFVDTSVDVTPSGLVTFKFDEWTVSAQITNYSGIQANRYEFAARTGGAAESAFIDDVCINNFTLGAIGVTVSPSNPTVPECTTATLSADTTGSPCSSYQWSKNGTAIAGATGKTYTPPLLSAADNGAVYSVAVANEFSSASASSTVSVSSSPPQFVSATRGCLDHTKGTVVFNKVLDEALANNASSYAIDQGVTVSGAALQSDGRTVILTTSGLPNGSAYTLTAPGVRDCAGNGLASGASITINLVGAYVAGGPQNMAVIEAENYDAASGTAAVAWRSETAIAGYAGAGYIHAGPDGGFFAGDGPAALNPQVYADYCVNFPVAGTYYFLARGSSPDGGGNSIHISLNGAGPNTTYNNRVGNNVNNWGATCGDPNAFGWVYIAPVSSIPAAVDVPSAGQHTFRLWMREDGVKVDQFVLTTDSAFARAECDPALSASAREGTGPRLTISRDGSGAITISWTGSGGRLQRSASLGPDADWQDVSTVGNSHIVPAPMGSAFFRFVRP